MRGILVIADISGYTQFLTQSELEHANGIVGDLLTAIIDATEAPLEVVSIEGDAVFMHGVPTEDMVGQTIVESVELLYCAFSEALETMVLNTTCQCNACTLIGNLGLKIVMHFGEYLVTRAGPIATISGPAVIAAHRLLKNHVAESTAIRDYLFVTEDCAVALSVQSMVSTWFEHEEEYEHIGAVKGYVASLSDVWEARKGGRRAIVEPAAAWLTVDRWLEGPPAVVWDHFIDPRKRTVWLDGIRTDVLGDAPGRVAVGTEFHCAHGDGHVVISTILDLRPYDYLTILMTFTPDSWVTYTSYLEAEDGGTHLTFCADVPRTRGGAIVDELATDEVAADFSGRVAENIGTLAVMVAVASPVG